MIKQECIGIPDMIFTNERLKQNQYWAPEGPISDKPPL